MSKDEIQVVKTSMSFPQYVYTLRVTLVRHAINTAAICKVNVVLDMVYVLIIPLDFIH